MLMGYQRKKSRKEGGGGGGHEQDGSIGPIFNNNYYLLTHIRTAGIEKASLQVATLQNLQYPLISDNRYR
ncbi:conserved hypothetical protein [Ricinus communis]|uniref:Uncharacterized protein n=1 Tax=Ricinus communis TaxID=3988 RepID=B9RGH5_RICCO|nr:conserved hypothetical protein [Ricinus communis]